MAWFANYRKRLLNRIYEGSPYGGPDKLEALWPIFLGGVIFLVTDGLFELQGTARWVLLALLAGPGTVWLIYVTSHDLNALRHWVGSRRGKH